MCIDLLPHTILSTHSIHNKIEALNHLEQLGSVAFISPWYQNSSKESKIASPERRVGIPMS